MKNKLLAFMLTTLVMCQFVQATEKENISIQFIVDQALVDIEGEQQVRETMEDWITLLNFYYVASTVNLVSELVFTDIRDFSQNGTLKDKTTLLSNMKNASNGFENIFNQADQYGADYTIAVMSELTTVEGSSIKNLCGFAADVHKTIEKIEASSASYALSRYSCDADTLAHEIGHLMGLAHGDKVAECEENSEHTEGLTAYAKGFTQNANCDGGKGAGEWASIMAGNYIYPSSANTIPMFSNLLTEFHIFCGHGSSPCGAQDEADSARTINEHLTSYSGHETPDAEFLTYENIDLGACVSMFHKGYDADELLNLNCQNANISSLGGIEQLTALQTISLADNKLRSVKELESYDSAQIQSIDLSGNEQIMCHELDSLDERYPFKVTRPDQCFNVGALIAILSLL